MQCVLLNPSAHVHHLQLGAEGGRVLGVYCLLRAGCV